jgi:Laminin B (Domain IV)/PEP-CTERM motif
MKNIPVRSLILGLTVLSGSLANAQLSTFDANDEGWTVTSFTNSGTGDFSTFSSSGVIYNAAGGNGGGYVSKLDPDTGDFYFSAPTSFLGNQSGAIGFNYDLKYDSTVDYQTFDVVMRSATKTLVYRSNPNTVPSPNWSSFSVSFSPAATWTVGVGGSVATAADFSDVLGNLSGFYIKGEYTAGVVETTGLDNVNLVPEPTTFFGLAVLACGVAFRRRRSA